MSQQFDSCPNCGQGDAYTDYLLDRLEKLKTGDIAGLVTSFVHDCHLIDDSPAIGVQAEPLLPESVAD